ncbi:MAG: hypothetical protein A3G59_01150 [Candidatus Taylorbacteria bacterium RIFCSPLOWO2_12_FULL_47_20]|uniref:Uncharacterized protein n=2 Tax=Candidatus Tayloriibacteriota TaxID=1817919 RepID=A0A1G2PB60_9BACT|nr:MAG: hypothetical protein A3H68_02685 [Candidatus Taylorbacteria bacterium RIFCSPLOWO2_02_FULL_46_40]OHA45568.1 MAG: hypothetical protein A3G59_01150 [Candidatus Taylorbacteria bacterium RIFCSPLOWO2_12_FULL_47_20]
MKIEYILPCLLGVTVFTFGFFASVQAETMSLPVYRSEIIQAFRYYKDVKDLTIKVPTVAEVSFSDEFLERLEFGVVDITDNRFEPHYLKFTSSDDTPYTVSAGVSGADGRLMADGNLATYSEFLLPETADGVETLTISSQRPITSSALSVLLDRNVALPISIEIRALVGGVDKIVLANKKMDGYTVRFPKTVSSRWQVTLRYSQPLRVSELKLVSDDTVYKSRALRFLAQPNHSYKIYFDSDRLVPLPNSEAGNLADDRDVLKFSQLPAIQNPAYIVSDVDADGVPDLADNCVAVQNTDQADVNLNGRGDVCDDYDRDGIINSRDNCQDNPNGNQLDDDGDGVGNVCDVQENRLTERYGWIPWLGIGFAGIVLIALLILTVRSGSTVKEEGSQ